jgi:hypothetical protein
MKTLKLVDPEELRIKNATDEVFRILTGGEPEAQVDRDKLAEPSSGSDPSSVGHAAQAPDGDLLHQSAEVLASSAIPGETSESVPDTHGQFIRFGDVANLGQEPQFSELSDHSNPAPQIRSRSRSGVSAIAATIFVSFGAGVLSSQVWLAAGDDAIAVHNGSAATLLDSERQRTTQLGRELSAVRQQFDAQLQFSSEAIYEATQQKKSLEALTKQLQQERDRNADLMLRLKDAQSSACNTPECVATSQRKPVELNNQSSNPPEGMDLESNLLITRADGLIAQGNISGARSVLERAIEIGSAKASFKIAETYDPAILAGWRTYGTRADLAKAREFYAKAAAGGVAEAKQRLKSLPEK